MELTLGFLETRPVLRGYDRGLLLLALARLGALVAGRIAPCAQAQANQSCSFLWQRCGGLCRAFTA